jgi:hypothetical protein
VVVALVVAVVFAVAAAAGFAGALMRAAEDGAAGAPIRLAANVAAETSDSAHAAAMVVTDFSLRVFIEISPCARSTRAVVRF